MSGKGAPGIKILWQCVVMKGWYWLGALQTFGLDMLISLSRYFVFISWNYDDWSCILKKCLYIWTKLYHYPWTWHSLSKFGDWCCREMARLQCVTTDEKYWIRQNCFIWKKNKTVYVDWICLKFGWCLHSVTLKGPIKLKAESSEFLWD